MSDVKKFHELYKELANIDINKEGYISWKDTGKGKILGYLQWAIAEELFLSVYDDYDFIIRDFGNGKNYYADETGAYVETTVIAKKDGVEYNKTQQLQILDNQYEPQKLVDYEITTKSGKKTIKAFTMDDVENTIQRCKVKNFQQFGLGASLYQGKINAPNQTSSVSTCEKVDTIVNKPVNMNKADEACFNINNYQQQATTTNNTNSPKYFHNKEELWYYLNNFNISEELKNTVIAHCEEKKYLNKWGKYISDKNIDYVAKTNWNLNYL